MVVNLNGDDMTEQQFKERYSMIMNNRGWYETLPERLGLREAVFRAAAQLLVNGFMGKEVSKDAVVGYLVDEGGWLYSQTLGTIKDVITREAEQVHEVCSYHDDVYMDAVHYVPMSMVDNPDYSDIVDGNFYALVTIQR